MYYGSHNIPEKTSTYTVYCIYIQCSLVYITVYTYEYIPNKLQFIYHFKWYNFQRNEFSNLWIKSNFVTKLSNPRQIYIIHSKFLD